jgi:hypothetical protein
METLVVAVEVKQMMEIDDANADTDEDEMSVAVEYVDSPVFVDIVGCVHLLDEMALMSMVAVVVGVAAMDDSLEVAADGSGAL